MSQRPKPKESENPPINRLCRAILQQAIDEEMNLVEIVPKERELEVAYVRVQAMTVPKNLQEPLVNRYKAEAGLDVGAEGSQTGELELENKESQYRIKLTTEPTEFGEKLTFAITKA